MAISFVGEAANTSTTNSTAYTITKPSGVASGDFMIAAIGHFSSTSEESSVTVNPPTGWTLVDDIFSAGSTSVQLSIMTRVAEASEPGSWNGSFSGTQSIKVQACVAYRGVSGLGDTDTATVGSTTSYSVGPVTNESANNWRIVAGVYGSSTTNYTITSNEVRYVAYGAVDPGSAVEMAVWDSNGTVATGDHSRTVSRGAVWGTSAAWISFLVAQSAEVPGDLAMTMPLPSVSASAAISYNAVLAASLPLPSVSFDGIASPPEGSLDVVVTPVMEVGGAHEASGSLDVTVLPTFSSIGETRAFGIRVVVPERESRVTTPRLGAVD